MASLRHFFTISLTCILVLPGSSKLNNAPAQFVYDAASATSTVQHGGCTVTSWDGMDSDGMSGPPWVSYVNCSAGASYETHGVASHGDFQIWSHYGQISLDNLTLSNMGESFWIAPGAKVTIRVTGSAYVAGAKFDLDPSMPESTFTSAFTGPKHRQYSFTEAQNKANHAGIHPDPHICNGSSPSMDIVFGSQSLVDPASVVVVNCAPSSLPTGNFVWSHFHPSGALYMPFSGEICFSTDKDICVGPGTARWTSANLQYYEHFRKINITNSAADSVREIVGVPPEKCEYPNVFAVTNFDGPAGIPGVPNFRDWPQNAHVNKLALGIGPWGVFPRMTVQATKVVVKSSVVVADEVGVDGGDMKLV